MVDYPQHLFLAPLSLLNFLSPCFFVGRSVGSGEKNKENRREKYLVDGEQQEHFRTCSFLLGGEDTLSMSTLATGRREERCGERGTTREECAEENYSKFRLQVTPRLAKQDTKTHYVQLWIKSVGLICFNDSVQHLLQ